MPTIKEVKNFWEKHPLLSYELDFEPGTREFFDAYNPIREEVEKFCFHLFEFERFAGKRVLDVGCGNGWLLEKYYRNGALTSGIDLTVAGIRNCRKRFELENAAGSFCCANAEVLPFHDNMFDLVTSLGVIHHTPKTQLCANEIIRVTRPGGNVLVCMYYRNILLQKWSFPLLKLAMRLMGMHRFSSDLQGVKNRVKDSPEAFVQSYDGPHNPLGKVYSRAEAISLFKGLENIKTEIHYFPKRFVPVLCSTRIPKFLDLLLDQCLGIMLYIHGTKPTTVK